ncbi:MAG TPA: hypothetical protein DEA96_00625 [Leptospiraceae bacterium]|nr:hypothetical protein [Spirochaetaceae bacterium]HBS03437.1 hypothetical protein [Leptospiraceae bacterium]
MANQAAIFDFDSVLFHERNIWKVKHPAVGILGMAASTNDVLKHFQNGILKREGKHLPDYYSLDEFPYDQLEDSSGFNILTPDLVRTTARTHAQKRRDVFVLSMTRRTGILDFLCDLIPPEKGPIPFPNPFETCEVLELRTEDLDEIKRAQDLPLARMRRMLSLLSYNDGRATAAPGPYERIFYHTTDRVAAELVSGYVQKNHSLLEDGRNAILVYYIARAHDLAAV